MLTWEEMHENNSCELLITDSSRPLGLSRSSFRLSEKSLTIPTKSEVLPEEKNWKWLLTREKNRLFPDTEGHLLPAQVSVPS